MLCCSQIKIIKLVLVAMPFTVKIAKVMRYVYGARTSKSYLLSTKLTSIYSNKSSSTVQTNTLAARRSSLLTNFPSMRPNSVNSCIITINRHIVHFARNF